MMILLEILPGAVARTHRRLALGLVCVLIAAGTLSAATPLQKCDRPSVVACTCCLAQSCSGACCCEAPPSTPVPSTAGEWCTTQRDLQPQLDALPDQEPGPDRQVAIRDVPDRRLPLVTGPSAYLTACTFLI
jgi:hypothetical protein